MNKTIEKILSDPRVHSVSDERAAARAPKHDPENGNGFWVYLMPGYINELHGVHSIHEPSPSACLKVMSSVTECEPGCECGI